jgi:hypothetical protein
MDTPISQKLIRGICEIRGWFWKFNSMDSLVNLIRTHGSLVVLVVAFLENLGLPIPALPFLVIAGCLVVEGPVSLPFTILAAIVGALSADLLWIDAHPSGGIRSPCSPLT